MESLAPIFTPPQSISRTGTAGSGSLGSGGLDGSFGTRDVGGLPAHDVSPENTKEVFDVARNSVELLNTVLTSSPQQEALQVCVTIWLKFFNCIFRGGCFPVIYEVVIHSGNLGF